MESLKLLYPAQKLGQMVDGDNINIIPFVNDQLLVSDHYGNTKGFIVPDIHNNGDYLLYSENMDLLGSTLSTKGMTNFLTPGGNISSTFIEQMGTEIQDGVGTSFVFDNAYDGFDVYNNAMLLTSSSQALGPKVSIVQNIDTNTIASLDGLELLDIDLVDSYLDSFLTLF
ncbi:hypothetical protein V7122_02695 [Bacillus sp. JJ1532]|uniref:hypothetical protein n=1 Tax=unclassified Bacillus (in: firmicutes) TaxID=185979 RepID=UPI002FFD8143